MTVISNVLMMIFPSLRYFNNGSGICLFCLCVSPFDFRERESEEDYDSGGKSLQKEKV